MSNNLSRQFKRIDDVADSKPDVGATGADQSKPTYKPPGPVAIALMARMDAVEAKLAELADLKRRLADIEALALKSMMRDVTGVTRDGKRDDSVTGDVTASVTRNGKAAERARRYRERRKNASAPAGDSGSG